MLKKLANWKLVLFLAIVLCFAILVSTLVKDFYELPSEGFSKEIFLRDFEKEDSYDAYTYKSYTAQPYDGGIVIMLGDGNEFVIEQYTGFGELLASKVLMEDIGQIVDMSSIVEEDVLKAIYRTEDEIAYIAYDLEGEELISQTTIVSDFDAAVLEEDTVVYSVGEAYYFYDGENQQVLESSGIDYYDYARQGDQLYITTISSHLGSYYSELFKINLKSGEIVQTHVTDYFTQSATKSSEHHMIMDGDQVMTMNVFRDSKAGATLYHEVGYDINNPEKCTVMQFDISNYPNFNYESYNEGVITSIIGLDTFVGKDELASADNTYNNLVLYQYNQFGGKPTALTKTKKEHPNHEYFFISDESYLIFNTSDGNTGELYMASSHPDVVKASNTLGASGFMNLFFGAMTVIPAAIAVGFIPVVGFVLPVMLTMIPLAMVKITWAERHQKEMLMMSVGIYIVSVAYFFYDRIPLMHEALGKVSGSMPWHLSGTFNMLFSLAVAVAVSLLVMFLFIKEHDEHKQHNFITKFLVMFASFSIFYVLLYQAYPLLMN